MHETQDYSPDGDLDWLAYQYVSGELDDAQLEAFEQRLAGDQSAREAVAVAVELLAACRAAFDRQSAFDRRAAFDRRDVIPVTKSSPSQRTAARMAVLAGTLAACVAIAWLGQFQGGGSDPGLADRDAQDRGVSQVGSESLWGQRRPAQQLAAIWADLGESLFPEVAPLADVSPDVSIAADASELNSSTSPSNGATGGDESDLAAPDWLMAALDEPTSGDNDPDEG